MVILTRAGLPEIRRSLEHLSAQTISDRVQVVVVGPEVGDGPAPAEGALHSIIPVRCAELARAGDGLALGVAAASAAIVAMAEEHSLPDPAWAESLVAAHDGPWVAVGPELANANPRSPRSWAQLFADFGGAVAPAEPGEAQELPGHNTSYKRAALEHYGERLGEMLEMEWVLHDDLKERGGRLRCEPAARVSHLNPSTIRAQLSSEFVGGRVFGAYRARLRGWSPLRRLAYVAASPLVFAMRVRRSIALARRTPECPGVVRLFPSVMLGMIASTAGQAAGYLLGEGGAPRTRIRVELDRAAFLNRRDREEWEAGGTPAVARAAEPLVR